MLAILAMPRLPTPIATRRAGLKLRREAALFELAARLRTDVSEPDIRDTSAARQSGVMEAFIERIAGQWSGRTFHWTGVAPASRSPS